MKPIRFRCEVLDVPGAQNVRDLGGYLSWDGRPVRKRRFLRAGGLHALTSEGVAAVRALGVDCIVDLRSSFEASRMPDTLREDGEIDYVHLPMLDYIQSAIGDGGSPRFPDSMEEMYVGLLEHSGETFLRLLRVCGDPAYHTVLFHCTAGKDRTGVSAMLLLGLAGVSREDIVEDYSHSERLFPQRPLHPELPGYLFESRPETMEAALDHLDAEYGGVRGYLARIGVDGALEEALLRKLLEEDG